MIFEYDGRDAGNCFGNNVSFNLLAAVMWHYIESKYLELEINYVSQKQTKRKVQKHFTEKSITFPNKSLKSCRKQFSNNY